VSPSLREVLLASGVVNEEQLRQVQNLQRGGGLGFEEALLQLGLVEETALARAQAKAHGLPFVDLAKGRVAADLIERLPADFARAQGVVPVAEREGRLIVAIDDPLKRLVVDQIGFLIGGEVSCALASKSALRAALARYYGGEPEQEVARSMGAKAGEEDSDAPIVRLVTRMFHDALEQRASDIHIQPGAAGLTVRFRVDGLLRPVAEHPAHLAAPIISRLKIMARMDIAEKRKPQDGRIGVRLKERDVDVRASILPTNHGESMVLRLLDRSANLVSLRDLGFGEDDHAWFRRLIKRPNGIVLVTGPTGSGKTTTLYAALAELNRPDVKIITAEDPVEYHIAGLNQVQVHARVGLTFARILKAMLRCAPNIILVGEIRDLETAEIAIQASLTGHLVFSTLHTNDAPSAVTRLADMGVKPFLISTALQGVMAQRLVRRLCPGCAEAYAPADAELAAVGLDPRLHAGARFCRSRGCKSCEGTGYHGRVGLFETLDFDERLREMIYLGENLDRLRGECLASRKLSPLLADGARKVLAGVTSVVEVLRVTREKS
jgi:type IV pilus assembly protein PilB